MDELCPTADIIAASINDIRVPWDILIQKVQVIGDFIVRDTKPRKSGKEIRTYGFKGTGQSVLTNSYVLWDYLGGNIIIDASANTN